MVGEVCEVGGFVPSMYRVYRVLYRVLYRVVSPFFSGTSECPSKLSNRGYQKNIFRYKRAREDTDGRGAIYGGLMSCT